MYEPLPWGLVRAPLLPVNPSALGDENGPSLMPSDPRVRAALAVASPDLCAALAGGSRSAEQATVVRTRLDRYLLRMTTRPTPFGLFAGVGLVSWAASTSLRIGSARPRTRTRPDMGWLSGLVMRLETDPDIRRSLRLVANPALLIRAGRVFVAPAAPPTPGAVPPAPSIRATPVVLRVLELARRPAAHGTLIAAIAETTGASSARAEGLLTGLWERGVLLTDLRPPLTGPPPLRHVRDRLQQIPSAAEVVENLDGLQAQLDEMDTLGLADVPDAVARLRTRLAHLQPVPERAHGLQVDMALSLTGTTVSAALAADAVTAAQLLLRLSPLRASSERMHRYKRTFAERYGRNRSVPLLELLDPDLGLGLPEDVEPGDTTSNAAAEPRDRVLEDVVLRAERDDAWVVELDESLLARLEVPVAGEVLAPRSLDICVQVAARSAAALDAGDFRIVAAPTVGGAPAGTTTGRFADLLGDAAVAALRATADAEAERAPGMIFAELVYAPGDPRLANLAIRPATRSHEITAGAAPGVECERRILLGDLLVVLRDDRFHIHWAATGDEVAVTQGHMLNPAYGPPAARFLFDVARDRHPRLAPFNWGPAARFPRLPRLQRGRIVLSLASWRLAAAGLADEPSAAVFRKRLTAWRRAHGVPPHVYLTAGDNRLLLDLTADGGLRVLRDELRRARTQGSALLQEALPGPHEAVVQGPGGRHFAELVVPMVRRRAEPPAPTVAVPAASADRAQRLRPPGSDWLYLKLYCPSAVHDELIRGPVQAFARLAVATNLSDRWFFIRYRDPEPHLRVRFHGRPAVLIGQLLTRVADWADDLLTSGLVRRFAFDTYEREVERYGGGRAITLGEAVFAADSVTVAELLTVAPDPAPETRVMVAVRGLDALLEDLGMTGDERRAWYGDNAPLSPADGRIYRERRDELRQLLGGSPGGDDPVEDILRHRRAALAPVASELVALRGHNALGSPWGAICASLVHMHCNRLSELGAPLEGRALALARRTRESLAHAAV